MTKLSIPSLQHLSRNWRPSPAEITKELLKVALNPPRLSYACLHGAIRDLLILNVPYEQIKKGIDLKTKKPNTKAALLSILPLLHQHFLGISPDFYQVLEKRFYPVGRDLMVPFEPTMIYGVGGQLYFPWFIFWRNNPLKGENLSLFVTLIDELNRQDPDLEAASFQIVDLSSIKPKQPRTLRVIDTRDIPRLSASRKTEMLDCFAQGYWSAVAELQRKSPAADADKHESSTEHKGQTSIFDFL